MDVKIMKVDEAQKSLEYLVAYSSTGVPVLEAVAKLSLAIHIESCDKYTITDRRMNCGDGDWLCDIGQKYAVNE